MGSMLLLKINIRVDRSLEVGERIKFTSAYVESEGLVGDLSRVSCY